MSLEQIKESGLLESYVIGDLSDAELKEVELALVAYPILKDELAEIEAALETYALAHAIEPPAAEKPMLFAVLNYSQRLQAGESSDDPPLLHAESKAIEFSQWLNRKDLQEPESYDSMHGYIIGASEEKTTLIVWLKDGAPDETHTDELETFLILEGTCNITIGDTVNSLKAGDVLTIPLHINHRVEVTSDVPCKIILERKAA